MADFETLGVRVAVDKSGASRAVSDFTRQFRTATTNISRDTQVIRNSFATIRNTDLRNKFFQNLERESQRASQQVTRDAQRIRLEITAIGQAASRSRGLVSGFMGGLAAGALMQAVSGLGRMTTGLLDSADAAALTEAKLRLATDGWGSFAQANSDVIRISNETRTQLTDTAQLYTKVAAQAKEMGIAQGKVAAVVTNFNKALKVSGANGQEASSAILQFSQALASGKLGGDEFRSLAETAPRFMGLLADALKVPRGELKKLAAEGKITSAKLVTALSDPQFVRKLEAEFGKLPVTFADMGTALTNFVTRTAGAFAKGLGITDSLAVLLARFNQFTDTVGPKFEAFGAQVREVFAQLQPVLQMIGSVVGPILSALVNNLGNVARVALVAAAGFTAFKVATVATGIASSVAQLVALERALGATSTMGAIFSVAMKGVQTAIRGVTVALASNPFTAIAVAVTAGAVALYEFSDKIKLSTNGMATLADWGNELMSRLGPAFKAIGDIASSVFSAIGQFANDYLGPIGDLWNSVTSGMEFSFAGFIRFFARSIDYMIKAFSMYFRLVTTWWSNFPAMLQNYVAMAVNGAISLFEGFVNKVVSGLNTISSYLGLGTLGNVNLGRVKASGVTVGKTLRAGIGEGMGGTGPVESFTNGLQQGAEKRARDRKRKEDAEKKRKASGTAGATTPSPAASSGSGDKDDKKAKAKREEEDKYAKTLEELRKQRDQLNYSVREGAIAEALGRAGLKEDPKLIGDKANAIRDLVNAIEDGKAIKTLKDRTEELRNELTLLGQSQRDQFVQQQLRNAGITRELEQLAKLNPELARYIAQLKEQAGINFDAQQKREADKTTQQMNEDFSRQRGDQQVRELELRGDTQGAQKLQRELQLKQTIAEIHRLKKENAQIDEQALIAQAEALSKQDEVLAKQERMNGIADRFSELMVSAWENPKEALKNFLKDLITGLIKAIAKALILNALMPGSTSVGGSIKSFLGGFFGGGKATGGTVSGGKYYLVGERGPEIVRMGAAGRVFPNHQVASGGGGAVYQTNTIHFHASGNRQQDDISLAKLKVQQRTSNAQIRNQAKTRGWQ